MSSGRVLFDGFGFECVVFAVFVISRSSAVGLNFLFVLALPVSVSISFWVGIGSVLETMTSFERGLVFSCCAAGVVFAGVVTLALVFGLVVCCVFVLVPMVGGNWVCYSGFLSNT